MIVTLTGIAALALLPLAAIVSVAIIIPGIARAITGLAAHIE